MKKLLLFTFALFFWTGAWAQNLSQGKYVHLLANGESKVTETSLQGLTNGNTTGDVQLATYDEGTSTLSPIQAFYIDLGEAKDLARVVIYWEGALCTNYSIKGSSTTADSNEPTWDLNFGTYEVARGSTHTETHEAPDNFSTRYIKFEPANNGSTEGYSNPNWTVKMREFQVFGTDTQILSGLKFDQNIKKVGTSQVFIAKPIDQNGNEITSGSFTYSISPSAGVTFNQNGNTLTITASQGVYNITATDGENNTTVPIGLASAPDDPSIDSDKAIVIYSEALGYGQSGSDAAVGYRTPNSSSWGFVNWSENRKSLAYRQVGAFGVARPGLSTDGMADIVSLEFDMFSTKAVDDAQLEIEDCYNSGHVPGLTFDVVAGWHHYSIPIDPAKTNFSPAKWLFFYLADPKDENIDILIDNIYYSKEAEVDETKPEMASAALASKTHNSATLTLNATDNSAKVKFYITEDASKISPITTDLVNQGEDYEYTISGLSASTEYNFTIVAKDAADYTSDNNKTVSVTTNAAPAITLLAEGTGTTGTDGDGSAGLEYSYRIVQTGEKVTASFTCTNSSSYTGLVQYIWDNTSGFAETSGNFKEMTYDEGTTIKVASKWAYAGGMSVTPYIEYTVKSAEANTSIAAACTDGVGTYYSTYSNKNAFVVPDGLTVSEIEVTGSGALNIVNYNTGDVVPANTGVLISSSTYGTPEVELTGETGTSVLGEANRLRATGDGITASAMEAADANCTYYRLTMHHGTELGFWYGAENGAGFNVAANKAYLAISEGSGSKDGFSLIDDIETNSISMPTNCTNSNVFYNLAGQRVSKDYKGIVIVNGKKMLNK